MKKIEDRLKTLEDQAGIKGDKTLKVREYHYFLFGHKSFKILTKIETVGDRKKWVD